MPTIFKTIVVDFMEPDNNQGFELGVYVGVGSIIFPYICSIGYKQDVKRFGKITAQH